MINAFSTNMLSHSMKPPVVMANRAETILSKAIQALPKQVRGHHYPSISQQIANKLKLGYDRRDLTILEKSNKVIVNPDKIERRIFDSIFRKPQKTIAAGQANTKVAKQQAAERAALPKIPGEKRFLHVFA